jgi:hypothetical protein
MRGTLPKPYRKNLVLIERFLIVRYQFCETGAINPISYLLQNKTMVTEKRT